MDALINQTEYDELSVRIETLLQKATKGGGFDRLTTDEGNELARLSLLAETWEDQIPLMPIRISDLHPRNALHKA